MKDNKLKKTLHIYTRVSTTHQEDEGTSLATQEKLGIERAKQLKMNYEVHNEGGASAGDETLDKREVIGELLEKMKMGEVKDVFVYNNDRLSRNTITQSIIRKVIRDNEVLLHTPSGLSNLQDEQQDLMYGIMGEFAQWENRIRTKRMKEGRLARVKGGGWQGGYTPFGYTNKDKKMVVDNKESKWVKKILKWWGNGKSPMWIKLRLDGNVLTKRGNSNWATGSIEAIVRNTHYVGYYYYKGNKISVPRIVSDEEYEPTKQRLKLLQENKLDRTRKITTNDYMLKPLLTCGHCGSKIGGTHQHGRFSYICSSKRTQYKEKPTEEKWVRSKGCYMNYGVELNALEQYVYEVVYEVVKYSNFNKDQFKNKILDQTKKQGGDIESKIQTLKAQIRQYKQQIKSIDIRLGEIEVELIEGKISKQRYENITKTLTAQYNKLKIDIRNNNVSIDEYSSNKTKDVNWYDMYKQDVENMMEVRKEDRLDKIKQYVDNIKIYLDEYKEHHIIKIDFKYPMVNDKIIWNNKEDIDKGYTIKEGRRTKLLYLKKKQRVRATRWFTPAKLGKGVIL